MSDEERTTNPNRTLVAIAGPPKRTDADAKACLVVIYGDDLGRRIELGSRAIAVGRSSSCEVQIDQESVSRTHCQISSRAGGYEVRDLGSTNGTYVNDVPIGVATLRDGDQLKIGRTILKFILGSNIEGQYHEVIYKLMTIDGLTQVHNKRYFDEAIEKEISRSQRYKRPFSLILFDIDHFKKINDEHGHLAGDAVLRQLGTIMKSKVRRDDIVARTGGEEFAVLTPEIPGRGACELANKLNRIIAATPFEFDGAKIAVTCSFGVAQWNPERHTRADDLVRTVDERLYEAKRAGRNRVCFEPSPEA